MNILKYFLISVIFIELGCIQKSEIPPVKLPRISFEETEFDFGEITQKKRITHIFKFKNIGGDTLIIKKLRAP